MLTLALANGFTGYSLPDDLLSGMGLRIVSSVVRVDPPGRRHGWPPWPSAGNSQADAMIGRMFVVHVLIVPAVIVALIAVHLGVIWSARSTRQFPGPGRTEHNVVGSRCGRATRCARSALFAGCGGAVALGGLVQINPVWLYGPFAPAQATSPAQPDWYVGWGDGALRLFPPWELRIAGHLVPAPFLPGVVLGGVTFLALYAWPFAERLRTGDRRPHHLLDRPRDHPVRLGVGIGALTFFGVLTVAAGDDIIARLAGVPVYDLLVLFRVLVLVLPLLAGLLAFLVARALRRGDAAGLGELTRADLRRAAHRSAAPSDIDSGESATPARDRPGERIELWPEGDLWRWRYRDEDRHLVLAANQAVLSEEEAAEAARLAYPGVDRVVVPGPPPAAPPGPVRAALRRWGRAAAAGSLLLAALLDRRRDRRRQEREQAEQAEQAEQTPTGGGRT